MSTGIRNLIWWFYADLKAYRADPSPRRRSELDTRINPVKFVEFVIMGWPAPLAAIG